MKSQLNHSDPSPDAFRNTSTLGSTATDALPQVDHDHSYILHKPQGFHEHL
jgi:hypothetical protein